MTTLPRLGPLELLRPLGTRGGVAAYEAVRRGAGGVARRVLARVVERPYRAGADAEHWLVAEAHLSMAVSHPNLLVVLDLDRIEGRLTSLRDWVEGAGLRALLAATWARGDRLEPAASLRIGVEIARALRAMHAAPLPGHSRPGLVHRAVSPSNVLVSAAGEVRLANLFLARPVGHAAATADRPDAELKPVFRAPESERGVAADPRADVYSLAALLYEALVGPEALGGDPDSEWSRHRQGELAERADDPAVPARLRPLLQASLRDDPGARPASVDPLLDGLRQTLRQDLQTDGHRALCAAVAAR